LQRSNESVAADVAIGRIFSYDCDRSVAAVVSFQRARDRRSRQLFSRLRQSL